MHACMHIARAIPYVSIRTKLVEIIMMLLILAPYAFVMRKKDDWLDLLVNNET